jgi:hypothetical protein
MLTKCTPRSLPLLLLFPNGNICGRRALAIGLFAVAGTETAESAADLAISEKPDYMPLKFLIA